MPASHFVFPDGYTIPRVINGGWQLSTGHALGAPLDMKDAHDAFARLLDLGLDTFDGADIYTGVEDFYGTIVRERRRAGLTLPRIHTKFVPDLKDLAHVDYAYVERILTRSLARLGLEALDLVQFHWWDYEIPGMVECAGHLVRAQEKGIVRRIGTTNFNRAQLERLLDAGIPVVSNQCQYSALDRRPERQGGLTELALERNVALLCYGTVAGGFLSEKWIGRERPASFENRSLVKYDLVIEDSLGWEGFQKLLGLLEEIGRPKGLGIAQTASLYALGKPGVGAVILGTRSSRHIDAAAALLANDLTPDERSAIDAFLADYPTLDGDAFDLERLVGGKHRAIMRMNLTESTTGR